MIVGARFCKCGREIVRGRNTGRWPARCTICRNLPPPPYEDHDRAKASAIGPDGWPGTPENPQTRTRTPVRTEITPVSN
jgi:hypothetical protein